MRGILIAAKSKEGFQHTWNPSFDILTTAALQGSGQLTSPGQTRRKSPANRGPKND
jgi:hypothetical protein